MRGEPRNETQEVAEQVVQHRQAAQSDDHERHEEHHDRQADTQTESSGQLGDGQRSEDAQIDRQTDRAPNEWSQEGCRGVEH